MPQQIIHIRIIENHWIARIAAFKLKAKHGMAITIGNKIYTYHANRNDLVYNKSWLQHEIAHVLQFQRYGFIRFLVLYLWESLHKGYYNNKFEAEARDFEILDFKKFGYQVVIH